MLLGGLGGLALLAATIMFALKLGEIGLGPDLSWGLIGGVGGAGLVAFVVDVLVIFRAME